MVAHDNFAGKVTSPVNYKTLKDGTRVIDEPHIGTVYSQKDAPASKQTGTSKGGTTRPPLGESGEVEIVEFD